VIDSSPPVYVLDADPDLASGIPPEAFATARERALARTVVISPPTWDPTPIAAAADEGWAGLLMIEGLLVRCVSVGRRSACELFGQGDVFRPWDRDGEYDPMTVSLDWIVPVHSRVAILDSSFARRISAWPTIGTHLIGRAAGRARGLALMQAVSHLPRVRSRLLLLFWLLAERWGKVGPDGVHIGLPLTHSLLSMLVGAERPTVTTALGSLRDAELLGRDDAGRWLLTNAGIAAISKPESLEVGEAAAPRT
jgi:hypothetical protein